MVCLLLRSRCGLCHQQVRSSPRLLKSIVYSLKKSRRRKRGAGHHVHVNLIGGDHGLTKLVHSVCVPRSLLVLQHLDVRDLRILDGQLNLDGSAFACAFTLIRPVRNAGNFGLRSRRFRLGCCGRLRSRRGSFVGRGTGARGQRKDQRGT